jgi:hypothetical protein
MLAKSGVIFGERNRKPAVEGGIRGIPPSTLRHLSTVIARGTLASAGRVLGRMPWSEATRQERVAGLALAQMWAQARLMGGVMGGNLLIAQFLGVASETQPRALA